MDSRFFDRQAIMHRLVIALAVISWLVTGIVFVSEGNTRKDANKAETEKVRLFECLKETTTNLNRTIRERDSLQLVISKLSPPSPLTNKTWLGNPIAPVYLESAETVNIGGR